MCFFVFSIKFARTREGRPARRKLTELIVKSKKNPVTDPAAILFVFQVNISCKTTSIILYFKYASFSVASRKKRQNTNPHPDGNFFVDRFGLGILRDGTKNVLGNAGEQNTPKGRTKKEMKKALILRHFLCTHVVNIFVSKSVCMESRQWLNWGMSMSYVFTLGG